MNCCWSWPTFPRLSLRLKHNVDGVVSIMAKTTKKSLVKKKTPRTPAAKKGASRTAAPVKKYVYSFAAGKAEGNRTMKNVLGGKGAGLAEMTNAGLPVPPGFTISTAACNLWYNAGRKLPQAIEDEMMAHVRK